MRALLFFQSIAPIAKSLGHSFHSGTAFHNNYLMIYEMGDEIQSKLNLKSKTHHIQLPSMFRLCPSLTQQAWEAPFTSHFMLATAHFCSCCTIHLLALPKPTCAPYFSPSQKLYSSFQHKPSFKAITWQWKLSVQTALFQISLLHI